MKKAVILHGTDGSPEINWLPWVRNELEKRGYEVWVPLLPDNHAPDREKYEKFLRESTWDFTGNLLIGHSSGATTVLNLLACDWFPHISTAILVGTFLNERALKGVSWYEAGQFDNLFPVGGFDTKKLQEKADRFYFVHGDNDPYCLLEDTRSIANDLGGKLLIVQNGLHLSSNRVELSEVLSII